VRSLSQEPRVQNSAIQQEYLLESAQDAAAAEVRFKAGTTDYLEVLTNETNSFSAELGLAQARRTNSLLLSSSIKLSGGGWQQ
jgi:outer membrane protein, multidrug efflux system